MITSLLISSFLWAQTAAVKDIPLSQDGETTISVKKGAAKVEPLWEVVKEEAEVSGDPDVALGQARTNWRTACNEWKKEVRELNTDNKVIALNCGKMACSKNQILETTCTSKANFTVKVKLN